MRSCPFLVVFILLGFSGIYPILAALPDLVVRVTPSDSSSTSSVDNDATVEILAKRAQFGSRDRFLEGMLVHPPGYDFFLCERFRQSFEIDKNGNVGLVALPPYPKPDEENPTVMLVPRGECTFERKAYAAKHFYGAKAILIYDRLEARYTWNESTHRVNFPQAMLDYECGNGVSSMHNLPLDPPAYNATQLDPLMGLETKMPYKKAASIATTDHKESSGEGSNALDFGKISTCNLTNTALKPCESQLCLVTSHLENSTEYPVCCAWDTPVTMPASDDAKDLDTDDILAVWLTIRQSELIFKSDLLSFNSQISVESRGSSSAFNLTYIFMWMWGTLVMMVGAWYAAGDYRRFGSKLAAYKASRENKETNNRDRDDRPRPRRKVLDRPIRDTKGQTSSENNRHARAERGKLKSEGLQSDLESGESSFHDEMGDSKDPQQTIRVGKKKKKKKGQSKEKPQKSKQNNETWSLHSLPPPERKKRDKKPLRKNNIKSGNNASGNQANIEEELGNESAIIPARESGTITPFEMTQWHVLGFVLIASLTLILLFFFPKVYNAIFALYGLGCAGAVSYLIFNPLVATVIPKFGDSWVEEFNKPVMCGFNGFSVTSQLLAYIWAGVWIWYGITHYRPETNAFFWISLNILGACFCILSVSVLKLTSIKIATILLVAIFLYDIFFVFITPFLTGGKSIMLQVAAGSENPKGDDFCYKYPDDRFCEGIGFLPMLFIFPKVNDYASGSVLLGLGDILLPGFLIAFSARYDEAARLVSQHTSNPDIESPTTWYGGQFFPMLMAYSLGLFFAFLAVILMEQGQPALLYICPICLVTIFILGRRDIKDLWNGANVLKQADKLIAKTERSWGKTRMKRFAERRRRENLATASGNDLDPNPEKQSTGRSTEKLPEVPTTSPARSTLSNEMQPRSKDICFGYEDHPGTRALRSAAEEVAADLGTQEYKPEIYKIIRKKLKGRRFFMTDNNVWAEASRLETRKQIGIAYDRARGKHSTVLGDSDPLSVAQR